jgi:hypothetical protein
MFTTFADGPGRYRIEDATGADAGWIRGRSIGFRGLRSDAEAIVAASTGWRTLRSLLLREFTRWPRQEVNWEQLRFVHDGAHEWVSDGRIPLARVYRTSGTERGRHDVPATIEPAGRLAVEFVVPSWMDMETVVPLARALWHVLAPLLGNTSHDTRVTRHASHPAWLPAARAARGLKGPDDLPPAARLARSVHSGTPDSAA